MSANDLLTWADPYYPDGRLPGSVREAITRHLDGGLAAHYTDALGLPSLREAIAARFPASATVAPHANQVIVTAGSTTGLYFAMSVLFGRGDEIIVTDPGFPDYLSDCAGLGLTPVPLTLRAGDGWQIDEDALEALVTERTRGLVLANPLNPTTTVLTRGSAEAIGRVAARHGLLVVNDEAFADHILVDRPYVSLRSVPGLADRTLTVRSFSKGYGLSGLRVGALIGTEPVMGRLRPLAEDRLWATASLCQLAAEAALNDDSLLGPITEDFRARAALVGRILGGVPGVRVSPIESGFLSWLDVSALGGGDAVTRRLAERGIAVQPGSHYGKAGAGYIRVSQGAYRDRARLEQVFERMAGALRAM